ncbi:hypothetical protein SKAU_G00144110 [Synaphobranchus kaupii]|uniref:Uncharacterized protein n=1 Tax=Synaphobranchus kaupii TaxID=118154 RepID=A0A9Q1FTR4_SYNKA|nr:hypothetical protein SKAU_G00144110 [Synaphobranchus kaupii]
MLEEKRNEENKREPKICRSSSRRLRYRGERWRAHAGTAEETQQTEKGNRGICADLKNGTHADKAALRHPGSGFRQELCEQGIKRRAERDASIVPGD